MKIEFGVNFQPKNALKSVSPVLLLVFNLSWAYILCQIKFDIKATRKQLYLYSSFKILCIFTQFCS